MASQEQFHSARGLIKAFRELGLRIPAVIRLGGNAEEIAIDCRENNLHFDSIVHACGSGGTAAGLIVGKVLYDLPARIVSFSVCNDAIYFTQKIRAILTDMARQYGAPIDPASPEIEIVDGYKGRGYALNRPEEFDFMRRIAHLEGLLLDPVYTGKAFRGMEIPQICGQEPLGCLCVFYASIYQGLSDRPQKSETVDQGFYAARVLFSQRPLSFSVAHDRIALRDGAPGASPATGL